MRRLTEIARIFTALNLINTDNTADHAFSTGSLYSWRGARGVQERLEIAGISLKLEVLLFRLQLCTLDTGTIRTLSKLLILFLKQGNRKR